MFQTPQWLKKLRSNSKRTKLGLNRINQQYLDKNMHVVSFVNWEYPIEEIMGALADTTGSWFSEHAVNPIALEWRKRRSFPIIFKVPTNFEMLHLMDEPIYKTVSKIGNDPISLCFGPMWNSQVLCYNRYIRFH